MSSFSTGRNLTWPHQARETRGIVPETQSADSAAKPVFDDAMLERLAAGDEGALAALFDRYARLVFGIALRVLRDQGEAEDIVQDVFLQLAKNATRYDARKGTTRGWISHIALHKAIDRRGFLARRGFYDGIDFELAKASIRDDDFESAISAQIAVADLQRELRQLPRRQRTTLEWFFFEGATLREISLRTGEKLSNVRHHFYRGLEKLRSNSLVQRLKGGHFDD